MQINLKFVFAFVTVLLITIGGIVLYWSTTPTISIPTPIPASNSTNYTSISLTTVTTPSDLKTSASPPTTTANSPADLRLSNLSFVLSQTHHDRTKSDDDSSELEFLNSFLEGSTAAPQLASSTTTSASPITISTPISPTSTPISQDDLHGPSISPSDALSSSVLSAISEFYEESRIVYAYPPNCLLPYCHLSLSISEKDQMVFYNGMQGAQFAVVNASLDGASSDVSLILQGEDSRAWQGIHKEGEEPRFVTGAPGVVTGKLIPINQEKLHFIWRTEPPFFDFDRKMEFSFRIWLLSQPDKRDYFKLEKFDRAKIDEARADNKGTDLEPLWPKSRGFFD